LNLPDVRTLLFVSKYRHKLAGLSLGWCFTSEETASKTDRNMVNIDIVQEICSQHDIIMRGYNYHQ